jgi:hypothetical protein
MKRALFSLVLCAAPAFAAISGTVTNRTTGAPQSGVEVEFIKVDQGGMQVAGQAKSDAKGAFTIDQAPGQTSMIRATLDGVSYTHVLQPGQPTTGLAVDVYSASTQQGAAKVSKHMLLFGPSGGQMTVQETFLISNSGKTTWNDPSGGTIRFYLPGAANGKADVSVTPPGGLPLSGSSVKTSKADVYAIQFPIRPGDSRIDVSYAVPYTEGSAYEGKIPTQDENTYLIAPRGVTLEGENLNDLGSEPQTQARIYGLTGTAYKIQLTGAAAPAETADSGSQDGAPQIEAIMPRVVQKAPLILALALAILAIGFVMLYRAPGNSGKETNERGRR